MTNIRDTILDLLLIIDAFAAIAGPGAGLLADDPPVTTTPYSPSARSA